MKIQTNLFGLSYIPNKQRVLIRYTDLQKRAIALNNYIQLQKRKISLISKKVKSDMDTVNNNMHNTHDDMSSINNNAISINSNKILLIIACHTINETKYKSLRSIMNALQGAMYIDIIIVNTTNIPFSSRVQNEFKYQYMKYIEVSNDKYLDFGKWYYGLNSINYNDYKFITFTNDSIFVNNNIKPFFDYTRFADVDLFGYNDSSQRTPHYQSYLFSVKTIAISKFIKLFNDNANLVNNAEDVVTYYELQLFNYFKNRDCFLKISHFPSQKGKNIFSDNDFVYVPLKCSGLLPFTKVKRITS